jgi:hypothetical protein
MKHQIKTRLNLNLYVLIFKFIIFYSAKNGINLATMSAQQSQRFNVAICSTRVPGQQKTTEIEISRILVASAAVVSRVVISNATTRKRAFY